MVFAARFTQRGQTISCMDDLLALYEQSFTDNTAAAIASLPHPTVQKFAVLTVAIVGASRRFLAQITRHQNEVKFMSASLQYSNYSGQADFAVPYEILTASGSTRRLYLESCQSDMSCYEQLCNAGIGHDAAGYATPQGLRNVLIISATPYVEYRKAGYSKKYRADHEAEILLHQAAKKHFDELGITKLPSVAALREEYAELLEQKRKAYSAYKQARADMKELHNVRANVEYLLEIHTEQEPQRSTEKDRH